MDTAECRFRKRDLPSLSVVSTAPGPRDVCHCPPSRRSLNKKVRMYVRASPGSSPGVSLASLQLGVWCSFLAKLSVNSQVLLFILRCGDNREAQPRVSHPEGDHVGAQSFLQAKGDTLKA